jgi:hypothetical protein
VSEQVELRLCDGTLAQGSLKDCSSTGESNCIAAVPFVAGDIRQLSPGNIAQGKVFLGVTGEYPSEAFPFETMANNIPRYDEMNSTGYFDFWDRTGKHYSITVLVGESILPGSTDVMLTEANTLFKSAQTNLDLNLTSDNLKDGITILNVDGLGIADATGIIDWDLRFGVEVKGVTGKVKTSCRNLATLSVYDGPNLNDSNSVALLTNAENPAPANAVADWWDTIDNYWSTDGYSPAALPTASPWGPQGDQFLCDDRGWQATGIDAGVTPGFCNELADECIMLDLISNTMWTEEQGINHWAGAIQHCHSLNSTSFGGHSDGWRLPTQKEVMGMYTHGFEYLETYGAEAGFFTHDLYYLEYIWSSTTYATTGFPQYGVLTMTGMGLNFPYTKSLAFLVDGAETYNNRTYCVRDNSP